MADPLKDSALFQKLSSSTAANFAKMTKSVTDMTSGLNKSLKTVKDLTEKLQQMSKDADLSKQFEKSLKLQQSIVAQADEALGFKKKGLNLSKDAVNLYQKRIKHSKFLTKLMGKQNLFNTMRFKMNRLIFGVKKRFGVEQDKQLLKLYDQVHQERERFSVMKKMGGVYTKAKTALKTQLATWFSIGAILGVIGKMLTSVSGRITEMGSAFGVMGAQAGPFQEALLDSNYAAVSIGKNLSDITSLTDTLATDFGISATEAASLSGQILDSATAMGLSTDEGAKLFGMLVKIGGMTADSAEDFAEQTYQIAKTNKILPHQVMKDIAGFSGTMATSAGINFKNLARGAIEARRMGVSINDIVTSTDSLMNIQSSIQTQRTTELITGEKFNLNRLRSLKMADDSAGMAKELQRILKGSAKFETANYYQRKAYTRLFGMEYDQLVKIRRGQSGMIKEQKTFADLLGVKTLGAWEAMKGTIATVGITISNELGGPFNEWLMKLNAAVKSGSSMQMINNYAGKIGKKFKEWLGGAYGTELSNMATNIANMGTHMSTLMGHLNEFSTWFKENKEDIKTYSATFGGALVGSRFGPYGALIGGATAYAMASGEEHTPVPGFGSNFTPATNSMTTFNPAQFQSTNQQISGNTISDNDLKELIRQTGLTAEALGKLLKQNQQVFGPGGIIYNQGMVVKGQP